MKAAKKKKSENRELELARRNIKFEKVTVTIAIIMVTTKIQICTKKL